MYGPPPQCLACKHWSSPLLRRDSDSQGERPTQVCAAFPVADGGIPVEVWTNRVDHRQPYDGDHEIRFEAAEGMSFPDWAMANA